MHRADDRADNREARFESVVADVYEPLQRYLGRRARAADVDDILNDTLTVLWRRLDAVPTDDPLPWSYGVARNCLANHRRAGARRDRLAQRLRAQPRVLAPSTAPDPELAKALSMLGHEDRELVRLWAWEQLDPREIAVVLDTTPNAVSLRLTRAKKRLAGVLGDQGRRESRQDAAVAGQEPDGHGKEHRA